MPKLDLILQGYGLSTDQGSPAFCGVTLIEGSRRMLVDVAHHGRRDLLLTALKQRGLAPADIDVVVLTHSHRDHMLNVDLFPNAEIVLHPRELAYARAPHPEDWATPTYAGLIFGQMRLREMQEGEEIDDGVRVLETPGHSPGSISLVVQTDDGPAVVCGDALPNARTALAGSPTLIFYSEEAARNSARKITDSAKFLYPGHDRPFELTGGKVRYLRPTSLHVEMLVDADADAGVTLGSGTPSPVRLVGQARMAAAGG